jgi:hypothetical protein
MEISPLLRFARMWDVMQRRVVILNGCFGTTYRSHLQGSKSLKKSLTFWRRYTITTLRHVISQNNAELIYIAAEPKISPHLITNFLKFCPAGAEPFHTDRRDSLNAQFLYLIFEHAYNREFYENCQNEFFCTLVSRITSVREGSFPWQMVMMVDRILYMQNVAGAYRNRSNEERIRKKPNRKVRTGNVYLTLVHSILFLFLLFEIS